jgi:predicted  nucleic acid-binding Zn ribbon protein
MHVLKPSPARDRLFPPWLFPVNATITNASQPCTSPPCYYHARALAGAMVGKFTRVYVCICTSMKQSWKMNNYLEDIFLIK